MWLVCVWFFDTIKTLLRSLPDIYVHFPQDEYLCDGFSEENDAFELIYGV